MLIHSRPPLGVPEPTAGNRAIALLDPEVVGLWLDEVRATFAAEVIRAVWEQSFVNQGIDFPLVETQTFGQATTRKDPLRTGIVHWERANGARIQEVTVRQDTVREIIGHISVEAAA